MKISEKIDRHIVRNSNGVVNHAASAQANMKAVKEDWQEMFERDSATVTPVRIIVDVGQFVVNPALIAVNLMHAGVHSAIAAAQRIAAAG